MSSSHALLFYSWPLNFVYRRCGGGLYICTTNEHAGLWVKVNGSWKEANKKLLVFVPYEENNGCTCFLWLCGTLLPKPSWQSIPHSSGSAFDLFQRSATVEIGEAIFPT
jgi:hypothetical protein